MKDIKQETMMDEVDEAEINGVVYVTTPGTECNLKDDDPCKGCVAENNTDICCQLPETCTIWNKIWTVRK